MEKMSHVTLRIIGMSCVHCENKIHDALKHHAGVQSVSVSFRKSTAVVHYNSDEINLGEIKKIINKCGYDLDEQLDHTNKNKLSVISFIGIIVLMIGLYMLITWLSGVKNPFQIQASMGYGMLFVIGLITSIHCVAMCGGINLSQCIETNDLDETSKPFNIVTQRRPQPIYKRSLSYNAGRVISYTFIGGVVGGIGSVFSLTGHFKGLISIIAGILMVLMGVNMMGGFKIFRRWNIQMPRGIRKFFLGKKANRRPFIVGLLNGLMPCGPLQSMQLYALGTGSVITGSLSMFAFSLGTVPLMFGFGALSTLISKRSTHNMMKVSAVFIMVLGVILLQRGVLVSGVNLSILQEKVTSSSSEPVLADGYIKEGVQIIELEVQPRSYPEFVVKNQLPVKVNFKVSEQNLNSCNDAIVIPEYGIEKQLSVGDNWIEFTPTEIGTFSYSCWMGMIQSQIQVIE